jgi:NTE family protein
MATTPPQATTPAKPRTGIVLSGTAPAMMLMSGAMIAFAEGNVKFDVISTTGVGALIGMLYLAPRGNSPVDALEELSNLFVSDWLYPFVPVNFKLFHKNTPWARRAYSLRKELPKLPVGPKERSPVTRFVNDWVDLWATALTPPSMQTARKGLMGHVPLVEELVDFEKLAQSSTRFYVNTFSLYRRRVRIFDNKKAVDPYGIDADVYNAAQAMFALFEPVAIPSVRPAGGALVPADKLTTGATHDPTGLQAIWMYERQKLDSVLALDPVGRAFWRRPENAYDAFQLMLMNPVAAAQEAMLTLYGRVAERMSTLTDMQRAGLGGTLPPLLFVPFNVSESYYPTMIKWTHANARKLRDIGYQAAKPVAETLMHQGNPGPLETLARDYAFDEKFLPPRERAKQFLKLLQPMFADFGKFASGVIAFREENESFREEKKL